MKWRLYLCSDCNMPEGAVVVQVADDASEEASSGVDYCPGCGSYLSMCNMGEVELSGNATVQLRLRERDLEREGPLPDQG